MGISLGYSSVIILGVSSGAGSGVGLSSCVGEGLIVVGVSVSTGVMVFEVSIGDGISPQHKFCFQSL